MNSARVLAILTGCVVAVLVLAGCGGSSDDDDSGDDTAGADDDTHGATDDDSDDTGDDDTWPPLPDDDTDDDADDDTGDDDTYPVCDPPPSGALTDLRAGVAVGDLYAPVGISMGGFGLRAGVKHPYAVLMGGSEGYADRLNVKAVTLDNGADRLVIARIPAAMVTGTLYTRVIDRVCELTGVGLSEHLWLSATHTHSGPDHIYGLPVVFGVAGMDTWDERIEQHMADSIADTIAASMTNLQSAKMAVTMQTPFDPDDRITHDRRCQNDPPKYKEDRMFMARVDKANGDPLAVLVSWGMHGTVSDNTIMTSDAPGAVEFGLERTFATPVPVLFMQGAAGDTSPAGSPYGHEQWQRLEYLGDTAAIALRDVYDDLEPTAAWTMEMVSKRLHTSRDLIGYEDGEFGYYGLLTGRFYEYKHGAWGCGDQEFFVDKGSIIDCGNPDTKMLDGYYGCYVPVHWVEPWSWVIDTTEIADIRLNDYLLALMPGELSSFLSKQMREDLHAQLDWPDDKIATFGYSLDHQGYLLTAWDWVQGGYETSMNFWGPKYGDWLAAGNVELADELLTPEKENNEAGAPPRIRHPWPYSYVPNEIEPGFMAGTVLTPVQAAYDHFDTVSFEWSGGYTALGSPHVWIQVQSGEAYVPAVRWDGSPLTDAGIETMVRYQPDPDYTQRRFPYQRLHRWRVDWEIPADMPAGEYRIHVEGTDGPDAAPYSVDSAPFTMGVSHELRVTDLTVTPLGGDDYRIACRGEWPPNPDGFRLRDRTTNPNSWSPAPGGHVDATVLVDGGTNEPISLASTGPGTYEADFTVTQTGLPHTVVVPIGGLLDEDGNTNAQPSTEVSFP